MRLLLTSAAALILIAGPANAKVTWRGNMCITSVSASCPAGDWELKCYSLAYRPPNVGDNGVPTLFAFGNERWRYGMKLATGSLVGTTYRAVSQTAVTVQAFSPTNVTMRFTTQTPATIAATTPSIYLVGNINNIDGIVGCNIAFRAAAVLATE